MLNNTNITLYNKYTDKSTLKEFFKRTVIKGLNNGFSAEWQGQKIASLSTAETGSGKGVLNVADAINVYISFNSDFSSKTYIEPKAWNRLSDLERDKYFTFQLGDRIVKGECDFNPINSITQLSSYDNVVSIMSIKVNDLGSKAMQHFAIGGK